MAAAAIGSARDRTATAAIGLVCSDSRLGGDTPMHEDDLLDALETLASFRVKVGALLSDAEQATLLAALATVLESAELDEENTTTHELDFEDALKELDGLRLFLQTESEGA